MPGTVLVTVLDTQPLTAPRAAQDTTTEVDTESGTDVAAADMEVDCSTEVMVVNTVLVGDPTQAIEDELMYGVGGEVREGEVEVVGRRKRKREISSGHGRVQ